MTRGRGRTKPEESERRCIATGRSGGRDPMIRFVLDPENRVVPDLAERLPGRGVWLTADRALAERVEAKRLFAKGFRRQVAAPEDLADLVERLLAQRLIDAIALARKAGQAVTGFEKTRAVVQQAAAGALIAASDAAEDGRDKLARLAPGVPRIEVLTGEELGFAFGRDSAVHAALNRGGLADRALRESLRLSGFRPAVRPRVRTGAPNEATADEWANNGPRQDD
ncbi:MAG: RNA-binding protein [Pseudomonadota bacterium]